jgi:hypothetical protein
VTTAGARLIDILRTPKQAQRLSAQEWTDVISLARRELVLGHLADDLQKADIFASLEPRLQQMLQDGLREAAWSHGHARGEARHIAAALNALGCPVIILKGSAYVLAGLDASSGRLAGDLDILVPRSYLGVAEIALKEAGFFMMVKDSYDETYYRIWMHELPPFQHIERKSLIDVHHTILPLTGRVQPDAKALVSDAVPLAYGLFRFGDADIILHSAAHWIQDGDLNGGLRNLHDIHRLLSEFSKREGFWQQLTAHADVHGLHRALYYAVSMSQQLFGTHIPANIWPRLNKGRPNALTQGLMIWLIKTRLTKLHVRHHSLSFKLAKLCLYIRAHWLRMPPWMTLRHLSRKAWKRVKKPG